MGTLNIILANMPINNGNRGCVALSITTMYLLDKILAEKGIKYRFYLPDSFFKENKQHSYDIDGKTIYYYSCDYPTLSKSARKSLKTIYRFFLQQSNFLEDRKIFKNADFIFDIGQGDSFSDIYGEYRFMEIDRIHRVARRMNIPYCILPQTIGPFKTESIKQDALYSIQKASVVMARDKQSYNYVKDNCPQKSVEEYIDVAFFMPFKKKNFDTQYTHVGLNISGLLWNGGYTQNNQFALKCNYKTLIRSILDFFLKQENVKVHLIGHVVGADRGVENDYSVSYDIVNEYANENIILAPLFLSPIDAKNYISGMDFFAGARMHATIAAFSSGVAVYPMAYSRKFNGLFKDTLKYEYMGDMIQQEEAHILEEIKQAYQQRNELACVIQDRMNTTVKDKEKLLIDKIVEFLVKK